MLLMTLLLLLLLFLIIPILIVLLFMHVIYGCCYSRESTYKEGGWTEAGSISIALRLPSATDPTKQPWSVPVQLRSIPEASVPERTTEWWRVHCRELTFSAGKPRRCANSNMLFVGVFFHILKEADRLSLALSLLGTLN